MNSFLDAILSGSGDSAAVGASPVITMSAIAVIVMISAVLGMVIATVYKFTHRGADYSQEFAVTLVLLCVIISVVVTAIGNNVARAFSFAGALSIIRFRTAMGNPRDIAFVLFSVVAGLCVGVGAYGEAAVAVILLALLIFAITRLNLFLPKGTNKRLKITIAENMNYEGIFDDILNRYCNTYILKKVSTTDLGTLFELIYDLELKKGIDEKAFIDELRCENGNLNISLLMPAELKGK